MTRRTVGRTYRISGAGYGSYTVLVLLVLAFLLPTICVIWFMTEAMGNERLAVRQRLMDVYSSTLLVATTDAADMFRETYARHHPDGGLPAAPDRIAELFPSLLKELQCDTVIVLGPDGKPKYPEAGTGAGTEAGQTGTEAMRVSVPSWGEAVRLEEEWQEFDRAAKVWEQAAAEAEAAAINFGAPPAARALALQGQARCLLKDGRSSAALEVLTGPLNDASLSGIRDTNGRLIQLNARLLALEILKEHDDGRFGSLMKEFMARLNDYGSPSIHGSQRLFLMESCQRLASGVGHFPTLGAERMARAWVDTGETSTLALAPVPVVIRNGVWTNPVPLRHEGRVIGRAVALYRTDTLRKALLSRVEKKLPKGVRADIFAPDGSGPQVPILQGMSLDPRDPLLVTKIAHPLTGWTAALYPTGPISLHDEAGRRASVYLWTGALAILSVAGIVLAGGRTALRQARLTRLKNDLTANVSHELKTPISSMRLLVDTLRDDPRCDETQRTEYLDLIARENARLSRLIDNFLTFSRMERNRHAFDFGKVDVRQLVNATLEAAGEKFRGQGCRLDVTIQEGMPPVFGDKDALVTVLLNLLENAWKYTGEDKMIALRAFAAGGEIHFEVQDNGIGIPPRARKRIFERFYQVDQTLSRTAGGCGLGLSIVEFIVKGHGGSIIVESAPGRGSTFTIRLKE